MNAIEIRNLSKSFRGMYAVDHLKMTVPVGAIYGFIGENGSGKSTTEKIICGLIHPGGGSIKLFGRDYTDADVRARVGVLIEALGCYPNYSVWNNMMLQAANLSINNAEEEVVKVLKMVRMEGAASNKYKNCSLGMKQGIGIDDYMIKSVELDELFLRIGALLCRAKIANSHRLEIGRLILDADEHTAIVGGEEVSLTMREFNILYKLLSYPKKTFTRSQLMDEFWDVETNAAPRAVDVYITKIRDKFSGYDDFEIVTVHSLGYKAVVK